MPVSYGGTPVTNTNPNASQTELNTGYGIPRTDTPVSTPRPTFDDDYAKAKKLSDEILAGKDPAHVVDPHAAENAAELARLQARLKGLNSEEMLAAKEQGLSSLDQSTAQNLERYGSIAGSHGVQGGAAASLMGRALQENNQGRAQLERQLILDNIAAKDNASQAYGAFLNGQTANGIGMSTTNTGRDNDFTALKLAMPFNIMSSVGTYHASDDANTLNNKALDILGATGGFAGKGVVPVPGPKGTTSQTTSKTPAPSGHYVDNNGNPISGPTGPSNTITTDGSGNTVVTPNAQTDQYADYNAALTAAAKEAGYPDLATWYTKDPAGAGAAAARIKALHGNGS